MSEVFSPELRDAEMIANLNCDGLLSCRRPGVRNS